MDNSNAQKMTITYVPVGQLTHAEYNPRTLSQGRFEDLQRSIDELDMLEPLIVNQRNGRLVVVSGNQRLEAMKAVGHTDAPCHIISVPLDKEKVINVRMNKASGEDDTSALVEILMSMEELDRELTGWGEDEILKLQDGFVDDELKDDAEQKADRPKSYTKEQLMDFAGNYVDPAAAEQFISWLP